MIKMVEVPGIDQDFDSFSSRNTFSDDKLLFLLFRLLPDYPLISYYFELRWAPFGH